MKLRISRAMLVPAAMLILGSAAYSQEVNVRARVPFDFVVGDKVYPSGEYSLQTAASNTFYVHIKNAGGTTQGLTRSYPYSSSEPAIPANRAKLIFHRIGDTYFLFRVWVGGNSLGREFPKARATTQLAMNAPQTETVAVDATPVR